MLPYCIQATGSLNLGGLDLHQAIFVTSPRSISSGQVTCLQILDQLENEKQNPLQL